MKKQLTAMILAISAAFMGVSFGVFADIEPTKIDIGKGNVSITNTHITYYRDSNGVATQVTEPVNAGGYQIVGVQNPLAASVPIGTPVVAKSLQILGATVPLTLSPNVGTSFEVSGNLTTSAPLTTNGMVNVAGNLEAKSVLLPNNTYSAAPVTLNGAVSVGGNVVADHAFTANGVATTVAGDMTVQGLLTNKGLLTVKKNLTLATAPALQSGVNVTEGNLTVNTGDFTSVVPLSVGGILQTKAGNLAINAPATAGSVYSSGNLLLNAATTAGSVSSSGNLLLNAASTVGSLTSGGNMQIKVATTTGSITAGGMLSADPVTVQTTAGGITAQQAIDMGGTVVAAGPIASATNAVTLRGAATATGSISGTAVNLKGTTNAASVYASAGGLTADAAIYTTGDMQAAGNMAFYQAARAGGSIQVQGSGNMTFYGTVDATNSVYTNSGTIFAQGNVHAGTVQAPNGTIDLRGNAVVQSNILAGGAINIAGAVATDLISSTSGAVTLGGNTTATTGVRGARVSVNNGSWLQTPVLDAPISATNRYAVDVNTPFAAGTAVTVKATGVNDMPTTLSRERSTGLRLWLPAGLSTITVQDGSHSYLGNIQIRASATPARLTLSGNSPSGGGGGGGSGGSDEFDEDGFWDDVVQRIRSARSGDEIRLSASKVDNMPTWVLKELKGKNVTLRVSHGSTTVALNGKKLPTIPANRVFYQFDHLKQWYEDGQEPEPVPSSSSETSSTEPSIPLPPPVVSSVPQVTPPPASSVAPKPSSSSSSEESSSEVEEPSSSEESSLAEEVIGDAEEDIEEPPAPTKPKRSILPLVIAGVVASLAAAGAVVGYLLYRRKSEEYLDDDRQDPPDLPM